jgi:general secretion pathway protein G
MRYSSSRSRTPRRWRGPTGSGGFTIIELLTVVVVMGTLATIGVARTRYTVEQAKVARAIGDLRAISADIAGYLSAGNALPAGLVDVDRAGLLDPWGRPYVYVPFPSGSPRTDIFGVNLNVDYDLYSLGPDGSSASSLASGVSQDDVVRGADGGFLGRGSRY